MVRWGKREGKGEWQGVRLEVFCVVDHGLLLHVANRTTTPTAESHDLKHVVVESLPKKGGDVRVCAETGVRVV